MGDPFFCFGEDHTMLRKISSSRIFSYDQDPGWYEKPAGTLAETASEKELKRALGFLPDTTPKGGTPMKHEHHG